jgi:ribosome-associated heat shock protein Hsp15
VVSASGAVRIDKWLWAARFFKTRSLATAACDGGRVDVNDQAAKPSRLVRPGDLLHVTLPSGRTTARVVALAEQRGPASIARGLYEDLTPPAPPRLRMAPPARRPAGAGRPTKRDRRALDHLREWTPVRDENGEP